MKRTLQAIALGWLILLPALVVGQAPPKLEKLVLAGPFAAVSTPMMRMVESGALEHLAKEVEFKLWKNPDQMRALALNETTDFIAMPTNVAANLYNRGTNLQLLNVSIWGLLWMISREADMNSLADFKGKEIAIPFRGDMPDIIFTQLAKKQGLNPREDFKLRYVAHPLDAMQLLITRRVDHALLAEPAISMALRKTQSFPVNVIAPDLHRSVDLQREWERLFQISGGVPQAGIVALGDQHTELISEFNQAYREAIAWCLANPLLAGKLVTQYTDMLTPEALADSLKVSRLRFVSAADSRPALEQFYRQLHKATPNLVGGKLPDNRFYYSHQPTHPLSNNEF